MTVLVTGATGLLGSHLTELLVAQGEQPRVLLQPGENLNGLPAARIDVHRGDMTDRESLEAAVRGIDLVLHCAARTGPWGPDAEFQCTNVRGLQSLVEVALSAGVRRLVHVSSITVHGNDVCGTADETAPIRVEHNPYSRSKVAGERLLAAMIRDRGAPVTIVRPGWIYGPRDTASFARFAGLIREGRMVVVGSGTNQLPLIYVRDAAQGVLLAAASPQATGKTYLLVNDQPVSQSDYLNAIAAELDAAPPNRHLPYSFTLMLGTVAEAGARLARRRQPPPLTRFGVQLLGGENRFVITRARQEIGFDPQVSLAEGVKQSIRWYRTMAGAHGAQN